MCIRPWKEGHRQRDQGPIRIADTPLLDLYPLSVMRFILSVEMHSTHFPSDHAYGFRMRSL
jgi:hypothetical protein